MEGSSSSNGVSPNGVRSGDPVALQALVDRRGPAVMAFCAQVCGPGNAARASAEAFARFRAAVRDVPDAAEADPESLLLGATRHAAASMARVPSGPPPHGRLRSRNTETCRHVPTMLAARASGALGGADLERLARHLERCERCAAMGEIFRRGELAYADPSIDELAPDTAALLMAALQAVSAEPPQAAVAPPEVAPFAAALPSELHDEDAPVAEEQLVMAQAQEPAAPEAQDAAPVAEGPDAEAPVFEVLEARAEAGEEEPAPAADVELPFTEVHDAAELEPAGLAAEPLPEYAPSADELGETMEWDNELPYVDSEDGHPAAVLQAADRRGGGTVLRVLAPVVIVAAFIVGALALANVFGGNDATPPKEQPAVVRPVNYKPVLTPLPVTVKSVTTTPASTGHGTTTTGTATGTSTTGVPSTGSGSATADANSGAAVTQGTSTTGGGAAAPKSSTPGGTAAPDSTTTTP